MDYDDNLYVYGNLHVQSGLNWQSIKWAFTTLEAGFWHPLTWLTILVDGNQTLRAAHDLTEEIERVIQEIAPQADVTVHPEPE